MKCRVFLVDDQPAVRRGLEVVLAADPELEVCGQAGTALQAMAELPDSKPDVAVIDLGLPDESGLDLIGRIRAAGPKPKILVFSMHDHPSYVRSALGAGADGYVTKEDGSESLLLGIHAVMAGERFLTKSLTTDPRD